MLAGMSYPRDDCWQALHDSGYRHVVCLAGKPSCDPSPLHILCAIDLQDLAGGMNPANPDREEVRIREVVALVQERILAGEGVVVHCVGGTGRTGTVIACTLKALGLPRETITEHMTSINRVRSKYHGWKGWPESVWQEEMLQRF